MRRLTALLCALAIAAVVAPAAEAASVRVMVVGRDGSALAGPRTVALKQRSVRVKGGRRCAVGAGTPLAVLVATRLTIGIEDPGSCGRDWRAAGGMYVSSVAGQRERGRGGWVYKVGRRAGTAGAADPAGSFGSGRLRGAERILWYWCREAGACQRTLEVRPAVRRVAAGSALRVSVRGFDDDGRGRAVAGATVALGSATATTAPDGVATLTAPVAGAYQLTARAEGLVRPFPVRVTVR